MATMIRNPYNTNHRPGLTAVANVPPGPAAACSRGEAMVRNLLKSTEHAPVPSLSSVQALREELRVQRGVPWSVELARAFGRMVVGCLVSGTALCPSKRGSEGERPTDSSEVVGIAVLGLLATVLEDWEDHVLYAVLVQEESSGGDQHGTWKCEERGDGSIDGPRSTISCKNLLELLTHLSTRSDTGESLRQNATVCLATSWRCLERLDEFTTLAGGNHSGGYRQDHRGTPWWLSEGSPTHSLGVVSLQSLLQIYSCSGSEPENDFTLHKRPGVSQQHESIEEQEQRKVSCLTILTVLMRYQLLGLSASKMVNSLSASGGIGSCTIPELQLSELTSKLIKEIQALNHSVLSPSSSEYTLPIAMLAMSVLSLLQRSVATSENDSRFLGLNQTIQSTGLVENLARFVFFSSVSSPTNGDPSLMAGPRWTSSPSNRFREGYLQSFGLNLFSCWSFCDNAAWKVLTETLETKMSCFVDSFWTDLLQNCETQHRNPAMNKGRISGLIWMHLNMRRHARERLKLVLETSLVDQGGAESLALPQCDNGGPKVADKALEKIIQILFGTLRLSSGASYSTRLIVARLLRALLADRRIISSDDHLSRSIWTVVDESLVENHFGAVLEHASTEDVDQPLLLALMDTMETILEDNKCCDCLVDKLGAHNLEALIYLVTPKTLRYDFADGMDEEAADTDTETPPHHNLSRMDETSICIEHEEIKEPRGLDHSVRLSVATALAHLAYGSTVVPLDESIGILVARISTSVNEFLVDHDETIERGENRGDGNSGGSPPMPSMDQILRFSRLKHRIATPENEDFLSSMLFTTISLRKKEIANFVEKQKEDENNLRISAQREKKMREENHRLKQQLRTQTVMFQREMSRTKMHLTQETRQLVTIHASERSNAEERSNQLLQQSEQSMLDLERLKTELQAAQVELQASRSKVQELNADVGRLQQEIHDEKAKIKELVNESESNREAIESYEEKCDGMQNMIDERDDMISNAEDTNHKLQENLEDLFADMCSLAQMYQHNENQEASQKQLHNKAIDDTNQKLAGERRRNEQLTSKMSEIEEENEKLYRKLGKYKERLEEERKGRREDQERRRDEDHRRKRNGPVSYLNSLHTSTTLDMDVSRAKSTRSRDQTLSSDRQPSQRKQRDRSTHEKENSSSNLRSSTSQRWTKY